jgi:hypothetical protein
MKKMVEYFTVMIITYHVGEYLTDARIIFPTETQCSVALESMHDPIYSFDKKSSATCAVSDVMSKSIRPKLRPEDGAV